MELSRGAQRLLELLESYARHSRRAFPFQRTLAAKLGVKERQVRNLLSELKHSGIVKVLKQGPHSAVYLVEKAVEKAVDNKKQIAGLLPVFCRSFADGPYMSSMSLIENSKLARKPPSVEKTYRTPGIPPMTITSPAGRVDPNPEFYRIQAILRVRRGAIERARDPEAYLRAILRAEVAS